MKYSEMSRSRLKTTTNNLLWADRDDLLFELKNTPGYKDSLRIAKEIQIINTELMRRGNPLRPEDVFK